MILMRHRHWTSFGSPLSFFFSFFFPLPTSSFSSFSSFSSSCSSSSSCYTSSSCSTSSSSSSVAFFQANVLSSWLSFHNVIPNDIVVLSLIFILASGACRGILRIQTLIREDCDGSFCCSYWRCYHFTRPTKAFFEVDELLTTSNNERQRQLRQ